VLILFFHSFSFIQAEDGVVLPDKTSLYLTAIEDAEYKDDKIECKTIDFCMYKSRYFWFKIHFFCLDSTGAC
jgi:hypothetical protein